MSSHVARQISQNDYFDGSTSTSPIPPQLPSVDGDRAVTLITAMGDMLIHCVLIFDAPLDETRLARALRLLVDAEPVFGCTINTGGWWQPTWERRKDLDTAALCTLQETNQVDAALNAYMTQPHDIQKDLALEARIFRSETRDTLCIKISHCVADAGGSKETAYLLSALYEQLGRVPSHRVEPNIHGERSFGQLTRRMSWAEKFQIFLRNCKDVYTRLVPLRRTHLEGKDQSLSQPRYAYRHLCPSDSARIKRLGRLHGATVNDVLITALARGIASFLKCEPGTSMRLTNTVDLRRYLPDKRSGAVCNLSSFSFPSIGQWQPDEPFADTLQRARAEMNKLKANMLGMGEVPLIRSLLRGLPFWCNQKIFPPVLRGFRWLLPPAFTNMGQIDAEAASFDGACPTYGWLTASVVYPPYFVGGISGFGDRLTLSTGFCAAAFPQHQIDALFDAILAQIPHDEH